MEKQRLRYLDIARGIAIFSVVLGHLGHSGINRVVFTYHLPIFYIISGYFFDARSSLPDFIRKKGRSLLVPFFFTCLLFLIGYSLRSLCSHGPLLKDIRINLSSILYAAGDSWDRPFTIHSLGAIWFLWALFWGQLMLKLLLKCKAAVRIAAVAGLFCLSCWSWRIIWLPLSLQAGGCALLFIYLGYLLRLSMPGLKSVDIAREIKAAGILAALAMWIWMVRNFTAFWLVHCQIGHGTADVVGSVCGCILLVVLSRCIDGRLKPLSGMLAFFGRCSLLFLTVHFLEMKCVPYRQLYNRLLTATRWAGSDGLYLGFRMTLKLLFIPSLTALLYRIPLICWIYGYPASAKKAHDL